MKQSSWLADCKAGYGMMSGWEQIQFLKKIGGCTKCSSWKHEQAKCKCKQARRNKLGSKGNFGRTEFKIDSWNNYCDSAGRSMQNNTQLPNDLTRLTVHQ